MPDKENVVKAYEDFVNGYECFCTSDDYEYEMHKAVLAMLKTQPQIVRCKDCKHYVHVRTDTAGYCTKDSSCWVFRDLDWFCADGERKDGDGE